MRGLRTLCGVVALTAGSPGYAMDGSDGASLSNALATIKSHQFVDLTHSFAPGIPHWKGARLDERLDEALEE